MLELKTDNMVRAESTVLKMDHDFIFLPSNHLDDPGR
jgi:hypothetical protein